MHKIDPLTERRAEYAYAAIREEILTGRVGPSGRLVQDELARRLGISRTPVREAMARLEQEGLVKLLPGRGAIVQRVTPHDILGIYEVREELERLAVRLAARDNRPYDVASLRELVAAMAQVDPSRVADYYRLNRAFHLQLAAASGNTALVGALESLWDQAINFHLFSMYSTEELRRLVTPHAVLADVAERGDPDEMARAMSAHIAEARGNLLRKLRNSRVDGGRLVEEGIP